MAAHMSIPSLCYIHALPGQKVPDGTLPVSGDAIRSFRQRAQMLQKALHLLRPAACEIIDSFVDEPKCTQMRDQSCFTDELWACNMATLACEQW